MRFLPLLAVVTSLALGSCATVQSNYDNYGSSSNLRSTPQSASAQPRISGIIGVTELDQDLGSESTEYSLPMIAAAWQMPVRDKVFEFGAEAGFSLGWDSERTSVALGNSVIVFADNNIRLFDLSLGAYASKKLGERLRLYGGVGPLLQWASVDLDFENDFNGRDGINENGFGYGYYTRVGLELEVQRGVGVGLVARWVDSKVSLGGLLGDTDLEALQVGLVVTTGF